MIDSSMRKQNDPPRIRKGIPMGIKLYQNSDWVFIEDIIPSVRDIMGLDRQLDRELINYLFLRAPKKLQGQMARKYKLLEMPEERINPEDAGDEIYRTYFLFKEQVRREPDRESLRHAAFHASGNAGKFAFCRLTGYSWPSPWCDAYSYRTYSCGLKSDILREDIEDFCREMIEKKGPFSAQAQEWLAKLPEISDEKLDAWASGNTERKGYLNPCKELIRFLGTDEGTEYSREEMEEVIRIAFDAYILMVWEERNGILPRRARRERADEPCRVFNELMTQLDREYLTDEVEAVMAILITGRLMKHEYTREWLKETAWSESPKRPGHSILIGMAKELGYSGPGSMQGES